MDSKDNSHTGARKRTANGKVSKHYTATASGRAAIEKSQRITAGSFGDGRSPRVCASIVTEIAEREFSMAPARARDLACDPRLAGRHAEQGDLEAGDA